MYEQINSTFVMTSEQFVDYCTTQMLADGLSDEDIVTTIREVMRTTFALEALFKVGFMPGHFDGQVVWVPINAPGEEVM